MLIIHTIFDGEIFCIQLLGEEGVIRDSIKFVIRTKVYNLAAEKDMKNIILRKFSFPARCDRVNLERHKKTHLQTSAHALKKLLTNEANEFRVRNKTGWLHSMKNKKEC